jgi:hypothetical protein
LSNLVVENRRHKNERHANKAGARNDSQAIAHEIPPVIDLVLRLQRSLRQTAAHDNFVQMIALITVLRQNRAIDCWSMS